MKCCQINIRESSSYFLSVDYTMTRKTDDILLNKYNKTFSDIFHQLTNKTKKLTTFCRTKDNEKFSDTFYSSNIISTQKLTTFLPNKYNKNF